MDNGASSYRRFLDGDDKGIAEIVGDFKDGLILYLNSFVNNLYVAEELAEDTFFRLLVKKPRFAGRSSFKSWLYSIGRNVAVDHIRHNSKSSYIPIEDMEAYLADESELERSYIKEERRIMVHKALNKLPSDYRQIIWLVYFEELSHEESAVAMKKSSRQIRNLLYRAKQALKSELEKEGFVYEEF
ncbi:MAG: RNA polymerase sigma factor [Eubacterium sp.]|nr:RNA polymerase sigma factor [Eubacterium sp.]